MALPDPKRGDAPSVANDRATLMREVKMHEATPQETFDHMMGSGALSYSWWQKADIDNVSETGNAEDNWSATLVCEDGTDNTQNVTGLITHESVMEAAREVLRMYLSKEPEGKPHVPHTVVRECAMLLFEADDVDFDADSADCLLQLMVLGEVVFG